MARYRRYKKKPINLLPKETKDYYLGLTLQGLDSKIQELRLEVKNYEDNLAQIKLLKNKVWEIIKKEGKLKDTIENEIANELPPLKMDILDIFHPNQKFERRKEIARLTEARYKKTSEFHKYKEQSDLLRKAIPGSRAKSPGGPYWLLSDMNKKPRMMRGFLLML